VNTPRFNPSQTGRYSIYLPRRDGRLSWPRWLVTYWDGLPAHRRSLQVRPWTELATCWSHVRRPNHYTIKPCYTQIQSLISAFCPRLTFGNFQHTLNAYQQSLKKCILHWKKTKLPSQITFLIQGCLWRLVYLNVWFIKRRIKKPISILSPSSFITPSVRYCKCWFALRQLSVSK